MTNCYTDTYLNQDHNILLVVFPSIHNWHSERNLDEIEVLVLTAISRTMLDNLELKCIFQLYVLVFRIPDLQLCLL